MEAKGIKETSELILAVGSIIEAVLKAKSDDGKIDWKDLQYAPGLLPKLQEAVGGISEVPAELKDLSSEESMALVSEVMSAGQLTSEKAKGMTEGVLLMLRGGWLVASALQK